MKRRKNRTSLHKSDQDKQVSEEPISLKAAPTIQPSKKKAPLPAEN